MRARLVLVPVALAAALLAGCTTSTPQTTPTTAPADNGVSALPAAEILNRATTALINAKSFHVKGEVISGGETVKADVQLSGNNGKGTLVSAGQTIEIIRDGEDGYLKVPADFLALLIPPGTPNAPSADQLAALLKDKYIKIPVRNAIFAALASAIDPNELLKATGTLSVGEAKTVNGVPTIAIVDGDAKDGGTIYVATTGEPYPIRLEAKAGGAGLDFSDFGATVDIKAPTADQVFDATAFLPAS